MEDLQSISDGTVPTDCSKISDKLVRAQYASALLCEPSLQCILQKVIHFAKSQMRKTQEIHQTATTISSVWEVIIVHLHAGLRLIPLNEFFLKYRKP